MKCSVLPLVSSLFLCLCYRAAVGNASSEERSVWHDCRLSLLKMDRIPDDFFRASSHQKELFSLSF